MSTSTDNFQPSQQASHNAKPLWAAVGILGVAVLGMGGTMIYQGRPSAPPAQVVATSTTAPSAPAELVTPIAGAPRAAVELIEKPTAAPAKPAPVAVKKVVKSTPKPAPTPIVAEAAPSIVPSIAPYPMPSPAPAPVAVMQICSNCGTIDSVTPVERSTKPEGPGIGAVAGGVAGAVLGNQVGQGNGRAIATILGAIGGGFAGNTIEKNTRKEWVYQVGVRMEDGSHRTLQVAQAPAFGSKVTLDGRSIRSNDGAIYNAPAPVVQHTSQQTPTYTP